MPWIAHPVIIHVSPAKVKSSGAKSQSRVEMSTEEVQLPNNQTQSGGPFISVIIDEW